MGGATTTLFWFAGGDRRVVSLFFNWQEDQFVRGRGFHIVKGHFNSFSRLRLQGKWYTSTHAQVSVGVRFVGGHFNFTMRFILVSGRTFNKVSPRPRIVRRQALWCRIWLLICRQGAVFRYFFNEVRVSLFALRWGNTKIFLVGAGRTFWWYQFSYAIFPRWYVSEV